MIASLFLSALLCPARAIPVDPPENPAAEVRCETALGSRLTAIHEMVRERPALLDFALQIDLVDEFAERFERKLLAWVHRFAHRGHVVIATAPGYSPEPGWLTLRDSEKFFFNQRIRDRESSFLEMNDRLMIPTTESLSEEGPFTAKMREICQRHGLRASLLQWIPNAQPRGTREGRWNVLSGDRRYPVLVGPGELDVDRRVIDHDIAFLIEWSRDSLYTSATPGGRGVTVY